MIKTLAIKILSKYKDDSGELLYFSLIRELRSINIAPVKKQVELIESELQDAKNTSRAFSENIMKKIEKGEETRFNEEM